jgi:hypothetical protein
MLVSIFAVRPILLEVDADLLYGRDYSLGNLDKAVAIGTIGIASFAAGVAWRRLRSRAKVAPLDASLLAKWNLRSGASARVLVAALAGVVAYVVLIAELAGTSALSALGGGRSDAVDTAGVPEIVMVLPMSGSVAAAILLLMLPRDSRLPPPFLLAAITATMISVATLSQLGNRRFLIPALLLPLLGLLARRVVRVRLWHVLTAVPALLVLATLPFVRSAGARGPGESLPEALLRVISEKGVVGTVEAVFTSNDTEMLNYIALFERYRTDRLIEFGQGRGTLLEFVVRPLPSGVAPGTPYSDEVLTRIWGGGCGEPLCPVASAVGVGYFDFGFPGVVILLVAFGYAMASLSLHLAQIELSGLSSATAVVVFSSYSVVLTRTNTVHALWWAIYTTAMALVVAAFVAKRGDPLLGMSRSRRRLEPLREP